MSHRRGRGTFVLWAPWWREGRQRSSRADREGQGGHCAFERSLHVRFFLGLFRYACTLFNNKILLRHCLQYVAAFKCYGDPT